jgi:hypothetical protein
MRKLKPIAICFGLTTALAAAAAAQDTRPSDLSKLPPQEVNPRPLMGAEAPSASSMTWAQALDSLRSRGYLNITGLKEDAQGNWWGEAQKQFDGPTMSLELKRNGDVLEQPVVQNSGSRGREGAQSQSGGSSAQPRS